MAHFLLPLLCLLPTVSMTTHIQGTSFRRVDPEVFMNVSQLITSKGYPCEDHSVQTADGFILSLQRIPHGRTASQKVYYPDDDRPVILVMHGLLSCSACWLENLANESLGFLLADNGIDVWMGNSRGNTYSRRHISLKPNDPKFWAWSWDEMAKYDLPAMVDYILKVTGRKQIYYAGHSQGTMIAFSGLGLPWNTNKIKQFFAFAPVAYLRKVISPIRLLAPFTRKIQTLFDLFGKNEFMPSNKILKWLGRELCDKMGVDFLCENILFVFGGYDFKQMNESRIPVYVAQHPAGTSVQNIVHYAQSILHGKFSMYDYGSAVANLANYNQTTPPLWNASMMATPSVLYWGSHDWLADPTDVATLIPQVKNLLASKDIKHWQHLDFIWAMDAPQQMYNDVIKRIHAQEAADHNST